MKLTKLHYKLILGSAALALITGLIPVFNMIAPLFLLPAVMLGVFTALTRVF